MMDLRAPAVPIECRECFGNRYTAVTSPVTPQANMHRLEPCMVRLAKPIINLACDILKQQLGGRKGEKPVLHVLKLARAACL